MSRGSRNDRACQLCFAEPTEQLLAGIRIGARCLARVHAIAADAERTIEHVAQREIHQGVACIACGATLQVDEERLAMICPNGHAVALIANTIPWQRPPRVVVAVPVMRTCARCSDVITREHGQVGALPRFRARCRTTAELEALTRQRRTSAAYYAANKSKWIDYDQRRRARRTSMELAHPPAEEPAA